MIEDDSSPSRDSYVLSHTIQAQPLYVFSMLTLMVGTINHYEMHKLCHLCFNRYIGDRHLLSFFSFSF